MDTPHRPSASACPPTATSTSSTPGSVSGKPRAHARCFALLTDFGLDDPYVGQLKGVLHRLAPAVPVIDISHGVPPHRVETAAFFLAASHPHFPAGSIFICVVDPGVGTPRGLVSMETGGQVMLAPDNGLLHLAAEARPDAVLRKLDPDRLPDPQSATFHGRDVLAPLAARLAGGESLAAFGDPVLPTDLARPAWAAPRRESDGVHAAVLHADRFGNVVLNLSLREWDWLAACRLHLPDGTLIDIARAATYAGIPAGRTGLVAGSQGYLELAADKASAAERHWLHPGTEVLLEDCR
ncbi:SAM hydrolase/SAM-dependent halogenase family protein [Nitratidesulfovibrio termitidis]|uniref:SAM hydrolase/SAM-dependent halogenase family protein n=1 Tax=Nitratidesulfovibrio termitidis TaxID=42252 RepID=UPI0004131F90|nr:SAM-dependent chlorinase/fluorinase [Nitratidesulfovibrio termitidis]